MAKNSYNPYYDVNQIYNYKGQYDKAKNSGDSQLAQQIASYAQQNYNNLRSNGYEDVAKSLGDVGYAGAKKIRDKYAMEGKVAIRPYLYNSKLKTKYGMSDADIDKALSFNETTGEVSLGGMNLGSPYSNVDGTTYVADVFKADLVMTPRVSRIEVDGFTVKFNEEPKYQNINITQIAFQNYYPETTVVEGAESGTPVIYMDNFANQAAVYTWLDTPVEGDVPWYRDDFDVTITPAAPTADIKDEDGNNAPLAYHIFSSDLVPVMVIKLTADGQPAYLYSKGFYKDAETPVTTFEEGKIYRMSAKGEVEKDGSIPIDEDDIDPMDRCLEITVDVVDWAVELVYPEF